VAAHAFGLGEAEYWQLPRTRLGGGGAFEAQLDQQAALNRAVEDDLQRAGVGFEHVVGHVGALDRCDRIAAGDGDVEVADRRFAHVEFEVGVDDPVGLAELDPGDLRDRGFGQDRVGGDGVVVGGRGETVDEHLARGLAEFAAGELFGGELGEAGQIDNAEPHRADIGHPDRAGVPHRGGRDDAQRLGAHREIADRRLRSDQEATAAFDRARHVDGEGFARRVIVAFEVPADDLRAGDVEDLAFAVHLQRDAVEFALQDFEVDLGRLAQDAGGDPHIDVGGGGVEQAAFLVGVAFGFPAEMALAVAGQKSAPGVFFPAWNDARFAVDLGRFGHAVEGQRNEGADGNLKQQGVLRALAQQFGVEVEGEFEHARRVGFLDVQFVDGGRFAAGRMQADMGVGEAGNAGQGGVAGEQVDGTVVGAGGNADRAGEAHGGAARVRFDGAFERHVLERGLTQEGVAVAETHREVAVRDGVEAGFAQIGFGGVVLP